MAPFQGIDTKASVDMAIAVIQSFVTEETIGVTEETIRKVSHRNGRWIGSSLEYLAAPSEPEPHSVTAVFSWLGTHERTSETPY